jgi:hypothetical protein
MGKEYGLLLVFLWYLSSISHRLRVLGDFYPWKMRPEVVLAARWCHKQILMSPFDSAALVFYWWSVDVFRLARTVKKLFDIFSCALKFGCKFASETKFCKFDPCNDPIPQILLLHIVYLAETHILSYQASWYVYLVPRYARKRLSWESPIGGPKMRGFWGQLPHGMRRIDETPKRHILGQNRVDWCIICGARALGVGCALAREVTGKKYFREPYI